MKPVKIIHCGDFHISNEAALTDASWAARNARVKKVFLNIIDMCREDGTDILLIAGDFFDSPKALWQDIIEISEAFSSIPGTKVFIAPGNHDPACEESPYMKEDWPDNVHIFKGTAETVVLDDIKTCVTGAGFTMGSCYESMLTDMRVSDKEDYIQIGVLHGDLSGEGKYNPINKEEIAGSNLDYLALGHIHKRSEVVKSGNTYYAYCGAPQGRGFDECGSMGIYRGTVSKGFCSLKYAETCISRYEKTEIDITGCQSSTGIAKAVIDDLHNKFGENYAVNSYRIVLTGETDPEFSLNLQDIMNYLTDIFYVEIKDMTVPYVDLSGFEDDTSLKGLFVSRIKERLDKAVSLGDKEEEMLCKKALSLGLKAFLSEVSVNVD